MAEVVLENVTKAYPNGLVALDGLDLTVNDGEFVVLVGPSGCGKTTALRMVAGLESISNGTIRIGDKVVNNKGPKDRDIAMVFQNYGLYPHMTVAENIGFALKMMKLPKAEILSKVTAASRILGLQDYLDRKPGQLSGGQRQRVAMGRAIVREPAVFLMDEPLSNLDAKLRVQMRAEVIRIHRRLDVATIYVTHDQIEAMTMGDRVAVIRGGNLQQFDKPQNLYDTPANIFVASFIGSPSINLFCSALAPDGSSLRLGSQILEIYDTTYRRLPRLADYRGRELALGIRPEHTEFTHSADESTLSADVELIEALGSELFVHFQTDARPVSFDTGSSGHDLDSAEITQPGAYTASGTTRVSPKTQVKVGERIHLRVDQEKLHFFDLVTGESLAN